MPNNQIRLILWVALFSLNFFYIGLAFFIISDSNAKPNEFISYFLSVFGTIMMMMSFSIPKFLQKSIANEADSPSKRQKEQTFFIIGLALNESVSLFAFIVKMIGNNAVLSAFLFAISIICFIIRFPKNDPIQKSKLEP